MTCTFVFKKNMAPPPKFVASMRTMYTDLVVILKTEKEIQEILQSVGVRQGDNMAPVLFLFLISAAAEALAAPPSDLCAMCESQKVPASPEKMTSITPSQRLPRWTSPLAISPSRACSNTLV